MVRSGKSSGGSTRSHRSAKVLSAVAAELKVSVDAAKQIASVTRELVDVMRKTKTEKGETPSALTHNSAAREAQFGHEGDPRFICYRGPAEAQLSIPLSLVEKRFLDFRLHAAATGDVEKQDVQAAHKLWALCSRGWDDEVKEMTPDMNKLFGGYLRRFVSPTGITGGIADGVVEGTMVLFEHKLQPADGYFEALEYFRRRFFMSKELGFPLSYGLLVLVASPSIQVVAVAMDWTAEKVVAEPLTDSINCFGPQQFNNVVRLAATLRAIRLFCAGYRAEDVVDPSVPFALTSKPVHRFTDRLVFLLEPPKVAKLTTSYCEEAHALWAQNKVAPLLYSVQAIGGGWTVVEMEFLGEDDGWQDATKVVTGCARDSNAIARLSESVRDAVKRGHSTGYVHGDLRLPNIKLRRLVDGSFEVRFIDFDWAGKVGLARYPALLNPELSWPKGADFGELIQPEHDLHFADNLVEQLRE